MVCEADFKCTLKGGTLIKEQLRYFDSEKASIDFDTQLEALRHDTQYLVEQIKSIM